MKALTVAVLLSVATAVLIGRLRLYYATQHHSSSRSNLPREAYHIFLNRRLIELQRRRDLLKRNIDSWHCPSCYDSNIDQIRSGMIINVTEEDSSAECPQFELSIDITGLSAAAKEKEELLNALLQLQENEREIQQITEALRESIAGKDSEIEVQRRLIGALLKDHPMHGVSRTNDAAELEALLQQYEAEHGTAVVNDSWNWLFSSSSLIIYVIVVLSSSLIILWRIRHQLNTTQLHVQCVVDDVAVGDDTPSVASKVSGSAVDVSFNISPLSVNSLEYSSSDSDIEQEKNGMGIRTATENCFSPEDGCTSEESQLASSSSSSAQIGQVSTYEMALSPSGTASPLNECKADFSVTHADRDSQPLATVVKMVRPDLMQNPSAPGRGRVRKQVVAMTEKRQGSRSKSPRGIVMRRGSGGSNPNIGGLSSSERATIGRSRNSMTSSVAKSTPEIVTAPGSGVRVFAKLDYRTKAEKMRDGSLSPRANNENVANGAIGQATAVTVRPVSVSVVANGEPTSATKISPRSRRIQQINSTKTTANEATSPTELHIQIGNLKMQLDTTTEELKKVSSSEEWYQNCLQTRDGEVESLRSELKVISSKLAAAQKDAAIDKDCAITARKELDKYRQEAAAALGSLQTRIDALINCNEELKKQLSDTEEKSAHLEKTNDALTAKIDSMRELQSQMEQMKHSLKEKEIQLTSLQEKFDEQKRDYEERIKELRDLLSAALDERERIRAQLKESEESLSQLSELLDSIQSERFELKNQVRQLQKDLDGKLHENEKLISEMQRSDHSASTAVEVDESSTLDIAEMEARLAQKAEQLLITSRSLNELSDRFAEIEEMAKISAEKKKLHHQELKYKDEEIAEAKTKVKLLTESLASVQEQRRKLEEKLSAQELHFSEQMLLMEEAVNELQQENESLRAVAVPPTAGGIDENTDKQNLLNLQSFLSKQNSGSSDEEEGVLVDHLRQQLTRCLSDRDCVKLDFTQKSREVKYAQDRIVQLLLKLEGAQTALRSARTESDARSEEIINLRAEAEHAEHNIEHLQQIVASSNERLQQLERALIEKDQMVKMLEADIESMHRDGSRDVSMERASSQSFVLNANGTIDATERLGKAIHRVQADLDANFANLQRATSAAKMSLQLP